MEHVEILLVFVKEALALLQVPVAGMCLLTEHDPFVDTETRLVGFSNELVKTGISPPIPTTWIVATGSLGTTSIPDE